ncbi:MAG: hypothetical protein ACFE96_17555, partial [Candidatus Hermodarchaeota archaeon]
IDIDDHFGDGLAQYFYDDPLVLYFSIHEFDFTEGDLGLMDEIGIDEGVGTNINLPVPEEINNDDFMSCLELLEPILNEFQPTIIVVAAGFDMYYADPIGNCTLTSHAYFQFAEKIYKIAKSLCDGKIAFILEGGYNIIGLPYCIEAIIKALLNEKYDPPSYEDNLSFVDNSKREEIDKIKIYLKSVIDPYWHDI